MYPTPIPYFYNILLLFSTIRKEYLVQFDSTFEVNSHLSVMKNLEQSMDDSKVLSEMKRMLPKLFEPYAERELLIGNKSDSFVR